MSAYERGAGAAWDGGPPGAEADYAPPLPPAPRPAPTTDPWTGVSYSQYPATYDYQAYPTGYPAAPYVYDPSYYQRPDQAAYYSNTRPPYPPLPTASDYNYTQNYNASSHSPVKTRTPERKSKSYRSRSRSVSPYIKKERVSPYVKKERISPYVKKERISPYVKKERISPFIKKERSGSPYRKKERSYSRTRDSSYEKEPRKRRSRSRSAKSRSRRRSFSNHSSSRSRSRTPSIRKKRLRKSMSSDSYSSGRSDKVSRSKRDKRSTSAAKKRSSPKHRHSSHSQSRSSSKSPVKKSSKDKKRSADTLPRKSRDTSLTPPQSYRSSKSSKSMAKGKRSVTPTKKYKSKERECLTPPRGYRGKEGTSGSSKTQKVRESSVTPPKSYARSRSSSNSRSPSTPPPRSKRKHSRSCSSSSRSSSRSSRSKSKRRSKHKRGSRSKTPAESTSRSKRSPSPSKNRKSKSPSKSRSPNSEDERRGQFTVADRKRYWKIHRGKQEDRTSNKSPVKEVKPPPGAVEKTQVDDIEYGDPPDIVGPNFADLIPSPAEVAALAAVATSSRSKGVPMPIKNDGSFLEMFKKMQEVAKKVEPDPKKTEIRKPVLPFIGKRRGGRVLKTGLVKKAKTIEEQTVDNTPKDAWSLYMQEVKKYRETSCEEECKTRPLVK